jgi:hypothetical protein
MPDSTAADIFNIDVRGRRGNRLRILLGTIISVVTFTEVDLTKYCVVISRRDTGQEVGILDLGRGQADCIGAGELMRNKAARISPALFLEEYSLT